MGGCDDGADVDFMKRTTSKLNSPLSLTHPLVRELKTALQSLDSLPLATKADVEHWYEAAAAFRVKLRSEWDSLYEWLPHELEHYLCDADIRAKEPAYAARQRKQLAALLE